MAAHDATHHHDTQASTSNPSDLAEKEMNRKFVALATAPAAVVECPASCAFSQVRGIPQTGTDQDDNWGTAKAMEWRFGPRKPLYGVVPRKDPATLSAALALTGKQTSAMELTFLARMACELPKDITKRVQLLVPNGRMPEEVKELS